MEGLLVALVVMYFVPAFIAVLRGHHNAGAIFVLNLLLGWTMLGWVVALVWAATGVNAPPEETAGPANPSILGMSRKERKRKMKAERDRQQPEAPVRDNPPAPNSEDEYGA